MAQKKTAKKKAASKASSKKTASKAGPAGKKKAAAKTASKAATSSKKKSAAKVAKKTTPVRKTAAKATGSRSSGGESQVGEQLRQCLENGQLTDQDLFATVARLLHDNLGYSALNFFRNVDPAGKGGSFELLAATGEDPALLFYADEPGETSGDSAPAFRIKFAARPAANEILDEGAGLKLLTLPGALNENQADQDDDTAGYPVAIQSLADYKDAALSILYIPFGDPGNADAVSGFVAAVLINPRPRYTKSDFEPATLIASLLRRNLLRFRLSEARAQNAAELSALRSETAEKQRELEERVQVLEEQTGDQHRIRKELEAKLQSEQESAAGRLSEIEAALASATQLGEERQSQLNARNDEFEKLRARAAELEGGRGELEAAHNAALARQKGEHDELLALQEGEARSRQEALESEVAKLKTERESELARIKSESESELAQLKRDLDDARSENQSSTDRAGAAESARSELEAKLESTGAEVNSLRERLETAQNEHEKQLEKLANDHDAELKAASSGSESQVQNLKTEHEKRVAEERAEAEARLKKREAELREEIERLKSARDDAGAERELLNEELEQNAARLKTAQEESAGLQTRIAELERQSEAASRERSALDERAANLDEQLAKERSAREESDRLNTSRGEENKRLQNELAARIGEVQDLQRKNQAVGQELEGLKTNLGSRDQSLQQEQERSAELQRRVEAQASELAESKRSASEQSESYEQLLKEEAEKQATAAAELQKARATIEQKETDYHNALYELKQKVNTLNETLERTRSEAKAGAAESARQVEELKASARELASSHERAITERETRISDLDRQLSEQREEATRLSAELKNEQDRLRASNQRGEALRGEIDALQTRIAELGENHAREIARREEAVKSRESEVAREIANRDSALQLARGTIETHEKRLETLERDLLRLREERSQLQQKLADAGRTETQLREEIGVAAKNADAQNATLAKREGQIEVLTGERNTAREEGARLRQDIGIRREREAKLEQAIAGLKEDIHGLNNRLSEANQKERELDNNITGLQNSLQSTRSELNEQYQKERKLGEELNAALTREKGSEEEGRLLASLTNAISNLPAFTDKLKYLRENVPGRADIERVVVYRLTDEDTLLFQDGYHGERRLDALRGRRVRLQDTTFGQSMVRLKPGRLESGADLKNPDLPDGLDQILAADNKSEENAKRDDEELKSFLCLPLMESGAGIGIMVIASTRANAFDDKHIRILGNIAPLFAVAVQFERNNAELHLHRARIHNFKQVTHYQERRYLKAANQLHSLSKRILPVLRDGDAPANPEAAGGGLPEDLLRELDDCSRLALPGSLQNAVDFLEWVETLGAKVASAANLDFAHDLEVEKLGRLSERIGSGFQNLYWLVAEALENVARHSQATKLQIALSEDTQAGAAGRFRFSVVDNGEGLVRTAGTDRPEHGTGLRAIKNLAEAAGGHADFARDANGHGLAVHVAWDPDENDLDATLRAAREIPVA